MTNQVYHGLLEVIGAHVEPGTEQAVEQQLEELTARMAASPTIYEPVVMTRRENIVFEGPGIRIDSFVKLEGGKGLRIGRGVHIASFAHVGIGGGETLLGDFSAVASGAKIISGSNLVTSPSMSASAPTELQSTKAWRTELKRFACVLTNAVVLPGAVLDEGAVLAAGGVLRGCIPPWEIWGGVPAKRIALRKVTGYSERMGLLRHCHVLYQYRAESVVCALAIGHDGPHAGDCR